MPALRLCGHKTLVSGDELRFYSVLNGCGRVIQLATAIALTVITVQQTEHNNELRAALQECESSDDYSPYTSHRLFILLGYGVISIILATVSLCTAIPIYIVSGRGTPTDAAPRKAVSALCYINLSIVSFLRILAFTFGVLSILLVFDFCECLSEQDDIDTIEEWNGACSQHQAWLGLLTASFVFHTFDVVICGAFFAYLLCTKPLNILLASEWNWARYLNCCVACTSTLTCCIFGGSKATDGDFADLSFLLANLFNHDQILDVTPSDVAAGLVMVRRAAKVDTLRRRLRLNVVQISKQKSGLSKISKGQTHKKTSSLTNFKARPSLVEWKSHQSLSLITNQNDPVFSDITNQTEHISSGPSCYSEESGGEREVLSNDHQRDIYIVAEGARFAPYAEAAYGWYAVVLANPWSGLCNIGWRMLQNCTCFPSSSKEKYIDDTCFQLHRVSLIAILLHLQEDDIVYASFHHSIEAIPYLVALDHEWKTVVISIRGTVSFESLLSDITLNPVEMVAVGEECGFYGKDRFCHRGMLACTKWIHEDLKRHGKLDQLLGSAGDCRGYRLRIVGHSLGAGIAAILSVMLRPKYPNLRCLAFAPPGCVFSENLAEESSSWVTSFAVDSDLIPRISKESVEALRNDVLEMIARIKVPKYEVFELPSLKRANHSEESLREANDAILCNVDEIESSSFRQQLKEFYAFQGELKRKNASKYIRLFLPGEVVQLFGGGRRTRCPQANVSEETELGCTLPQHTYTARWAKRKDFERIILSSHLMWDHDPVKVTRSLQEVASDFGLSPPYTIQRQEGTPYTIHRQEDDEEVASC
jgi:sn1-specific diacylglycerol lipase